MVMKMSSRKMTTRKTLIFACFGIAIGLCIGTMLKNYKALEIVRRCDFRQKIRCKFLFIFLVLDTIIIFMNEICSIFVLRRQTNILRMSFFVYILLNFLKGNFSQKFAFFRILFILNAI